MLTQPQLAKVFATRRRLSAPSISSWESELQPVIPPEDRLTDYAVFFSTERSRAGETLRLVPDEELTTDERQARDDLREELLALRAAATGLPLAKGFAEGSGLRPWRFADNRPITIVCAELPRELQMSYTDPANPDYVALYRYADLDSLLELHGHIRSVNPVSQVNVRLAARMVADDYTTHLVLLGGVDWNPATRLVLQHLREMPVTQVSRDEHDGYFEVVDGSQTCRFGAALLDPKGTRPLLIQDVAHVYRGPNPLNKKRTVTICNGMYGRGTLGAVRALTDARFRDRNADYVERRFGGFERFSILSRVRILEGEVVTPDWTVPDNTLHEWP